jgi:hypothetical protein
MAKANYFYGFPLEQPIIDKVHNVTDAWWMRRALLEVAKDEVLDFLEANYPGVKIGHLNTLGPNQII